MKKKYIKDPSTGLNIGGVLMNVLRYGECSLQEALLQRLNKNLSQFREAQRRIDAQRKS